MDGLIWLEGIRPYRAMDCSGSIQLYRAHHKGSTFAVLALQCGKRFQLCQFALREYRHSEQCLLPC